MLLSALGLVLGKPAVRSALRRWGLFLLGMAGGILLISGSLPALGRGAAMLILPLALWRFLRSEERRLLE
jgi:hypothetical protein